jgi:CubicO group peptidase (beta-lactamase class C family)
MSNLKLILSFLFSWLICNTSAQNLNSQLNVISSNNDIMGGSLVVFCKEGITSILAVGTADFNRNINVTEETKYRIASVSKTITAIAVMQLVDQELLDLDEDIAEILEFPVVNPNYPNIEITTRMLLAHTSSIIDGPTYSSFLNATVNNNPIPNLSEILTPSGAYYSATQFTNTIPGNYFNYSNINYVILGTIIEKVSEQRFDVFCKENISDPLQIDASFNVNDLSDIDELAVLYRKIGGVWTPQADNFNGEQPIFSNLDNYVVGTNGGRFGPQGGFRCSAQDVAKIFAIFLNQGQANGVALISPESCQAMLSNEWTFNGNNGNNYFGLFRSWGLGIHRITSIAGNDVVLPGSISMYGHAGEAYGLVSSAYVDTLRKVGFVFLTNGVGNGFATNNFSIFYTVEQEVFNAIEDYGNIEECTLNVSIFSNESESFKGQTIYPNPANDFLMVNIPDFRGNLLAEIFTLSGKKVKEELITHLNYQIFIGDLESGVYIFRVGNTTHKFIKE